MTEHLLVRFAEHLVEMDTVTRPGPADLRRAAVRHVALRIRLLVCPLLGHRPLRPLDMDVIAAADKRVATGLGVWWVCPCGKRNDGRVY